MRHEAKVAFICSCALLAELAVISKYTYLFVSLSSDSL